MNQVMVVKHNCWGNASKVLENFSVQRQTLNEWEAKGYVRTSPINKKTKVYNFTDIDKTIDALSRGVRPRVHYRKQN